MSEFCRGVAVSSSFGVLESAVLIAVAIFALGLYTFRMRCASSRIARSHGTMDSSSALRAANWYEQTITASLSAGRSKGFETPALIAALNDFVSRITAGRKNLSASSCTHCLRRLAGTTTMTRRRRLAQRCVRTSPASIVLPRPTSSARMTPLENGERNAKSAASTWWGLRSTWASSSALPMRAESPTGWRRRNSRAKSFA